MPINFYPNKVNINGDASLRASVFIRGVRVQFSLGFSVTPSKWDKLKQQMKKGTSNAKGMPYHLINTHLKAIENVFSEFENQCIIDKRTPSKDELKSLYLTNFNQEKSQKSEGLFFDFFDEFTQEEGRNRQWSKNTYAGFAGLKVILKNYRPTLAFEDLSEQGLYQWLAFLEGKEMKNSTAKQHLMHLKTFLKWATKKGYNHQRAFEQFMPVLKITEKKIIFLTWEELMQVYHLKLENQPLQLVRDIFCWSCFTSLRISDVLDLKWTDITENHIHVVTKKTNTSISIDLNDYTRAILEQYRGLNLPKGVVFERMPVMEINRNIKELGRICGMNQPIKNTYYVGGVRKEKVRQKWELLSSHVGRKTFVCNALMLGISPQVVMKWTGHKDYKSMKPYIEVADTQKQQSMDLFNKK